jgi:hypothetical protein
MAAKDNPKLRSTLARQLISLSECASKRELKGRALEYVPGGPLRAMTSPPHLSSLMMLASTRR